MPIPAALRRVYNTKRWKALSAELRVEASWRCECIGHCGKHHDGRCVERDGCLAQWALPSPVAMNVWQQTRLPFAHDVDNVRLFDKQGFIITDATKARAVRVPLVRLAVVHLDHGEDPALFFDRRNLRVMCQRCHLLYDQEQHLASRRRRQRSERAAALPELASAAVVVSTVALVGEVLSVVARSDDQVQRKLDAAGGDLNAAVAANRERLRAERRERNAKDVTPKKEEA